ncbi:unnamed protein product, partial [Discosporangium mesarthrocarpum]
MQALKDYRLFIEYKHMKQHAPGGVFVIPSINKLRTWYGVVFVRRGHYAGGIFKFRVDLPPEYNDVNTWPAITFTSQVFNPLVSPQTGELDLKAFFTEWVPTKHYMVNALTYLKKVFYMKDFPFENPANPVAHALFQEDKRVFLERVDACVRASQDSVYVNEPGSSIRFTEPKPAHDVLRDQILRLDLSGRPVSSVGEGGERGDVPASTGVGAKGVVLDDVRVAAEAEAEASGVGDNP